MNCWAEAFIKINGNKISLLCGLESLWQKFCVNFKCNFTWKVNVICWVSAERTLWRKRGRRKDIRLILSVILILLLSDQQQNWSVAGNYSRPNECVCVGFLSLGSLATRLSTHPPIWTLNQLASIANQLNLSSMMIKANYRSQHTLFFQLLLDQ